MGQKQPEITDRAKRDIVSLSILPNHGDDRELARKIHEATGIHWDDDPDAGPLLYVPVNS